MTKHCKSSAAAARSASTNRFLKPGELARFRNSQIRTTIKVSDELIFAARSPMADESGQIEIDESLLLSAKIFGPRFLHRKKLVAGKPVFISPPAITPIESTNESLVEAETASDWSADIAAH